MDDDSSSSSMAAIASARSRAATPSGNGALDRAKSATALLIPLLDSPASTTAPEKLFKCLSTFKSACGSSATASRSSAGRVVGDASSEATVIAYLAGSGVVPKLIPLLRRPNSKIVDVTLSILGDLVLHELPRSQARDHGGVRGLVKLISTLAEGKILGRACRAIGNLAQDPRGARDFNNLGVVPLLLKLLKELSNPLAKAASIRAIRILCEAKENRKVATESNAVMVITSQLRCDDVELQKATLKFLLAVTSDFPRDNGQICNQIEHEGFAFVKLIEFAQSAEKKSIWIPAMLTLSNLSKVESLRPHLGNAGTIQAFVQKLSGDGRSQLSTKELMQCMDALCLYCNESVNRVKVRELGGLQFFVALLSEDSASAPHQRALQDKVLGALLKFGYDNTSMKYLEYAGILPCLVTFLNEHTKLYPYAHQCDDLEFHEDSGVEEADGSEGVNSDSNLSDDNCSTDTGCSSSSGCGGGLSLDLQPFSPAKSSSRAKRPKLSPSTRRVTANHSGPPKSCHHRTDCILRIMLRLYEIPPFGEQLTSSPTIKAVVRYILWTKNPSHRAGLLLDRLSKRIEAVMPFLLQDLFPWMRLELLSRLRTADLLRCEPCHNIDSLFSTINQNFILTAESGYIEGIVCHTLVKGKAQIRPVMTIGITTMVVCRTLLFNILITHGGLDVLLESLERESGDLFEHSVLSLNQLAERIDVISSINGSLNECRPPAVDSSLISLEEDSTACFYHTSERPNDLELILDDGSSLMANRSMLSEANSVFEAMLNGQFSESSSSKVALKKTTNESMEFLLHYLYGCRTRCPVISRLYQLVQDTRESNLNTLLDLVPLSDKYFLDELNQSVCNCIMEVCTRDPGQMTVAYRRSLDIVCPGRGSEDSLNLSLVSFLLVGQIEHSQRVQLFAQLAKSETVQSDFIEDVGTIIKSSLKSSLRLKNKRFSLRTVK